MRIVVICEPKLITYVSEDKLIFIGKFVLFYISLQRCRGPPHTQISKITNEKVCTLKQRRNRAISKLKKKLED